MSGKLIQICSFTEFCSKANASESSQNYYWKDLFRISKNPEKKSIWIVETCLKKELMAKVAWNALYCEFVLYSIISFLWAI